MRFVVALVHQIVKSKLPVGADLSVATFIKHSTTGIFPSLAARNKLACYKVYPIGGFVRMEGLLSQKMVLRIYISVNWTTVKHIRKNELCQLWMWKSSCSPAVSRLNILVSLRLNIKTDLMGRLCNVTHVAYGAAKVV